MDRRRTVPCGGAARPPLPHVRLDACFAHVVPVYRLRARQRYVPPAEIKPREVAAHQRGARLRVFDNLRLEHLRRKHVERVCTGLQMPAEVRLRRALGEYRRRGELAGDAPLRVRYVHAARRVDSLGPIHVAELEATVVEPRDLLRDFVLKGRLLVDVAAEGGKLADIQHPAYLAARMLLRTRCTMSARAPREPVWRFRRVVRVVQQLAAELKHPAFRMARRIHRVLLDGDLAFVRAAGERRRQRERARVVQARVGDGRHVAAPQPDVRLQQVKARLDASRPYLAQHVPYVVIAAGIELLVGTVVADRGPAIVVGELGVVDEHQTESASLRQLDVLIHVAGIERVAPADGCVYDR